jgi:hypothetical protein
MWLRKLLLAAILLVGTAKISDADNPAQAERQSINNWRELRVALRQCWSPPSGTEGSYISFRFGLSKDGAIRGAPMVTATHLVGSAEDQRKFREAADNALEKCFPAPLTEGFGATMATNPIFLRFVDGKSEMPFSVDLQNRSQLTVFSKD